MLFAAALSFVCMADTAQSLSSNMDPSVKPGDDFWQYAVGGWLKANPLDAQHPENGAFTDLSELNNDRINNLIMAYAEKKNLPQGSDGQKIVALYRLYMDSVSRNKMGYEPFMPYLRQVREVQTREEALKLMYALDAKGLILLPELRSMALTLGKARTNSALHSLNHVIRHKPLHNIPLMQGFLQLFVILQRPTDENLKYK